MATQAARAARNNEARTRLAAAQDSISKRLDIPIPPEPRRMKDFGLQPIVEIERFADFAESVDRAISALASADETPAGYDALTVAMLREEIARRGLDAPAGSRKDDLVALLELDDQTAPDGRGISA